MPSHPYLRLFGAFATIPIAALSIGVIFGRQTALSTVPALFVAFFGALATMALINGSVWFAERGGKGAYRIDGKKEPFWYWLIVATYGVFSLAFACLYVPR